MAGFFVWEAHDIAPNHAKGVLCVFKAPGPLNLSSFWQTVRSGVKSALVPVELVVLYACGYELDGIGEQLEAGAHEPELSNLVADCPLVVAGISCEFVANTAEPCASNGSQIEGLSALTICHATLLGRGLEILAERGQVIIRAPHGYHFAKAEDQNSNYFIRAENAFLDGPELAFFSLALLAKIPRLNLSSVRVDSASIFGPVYSMLAHYVRFFPGIEIPTVESFHSWANAAQLRPEQDIIGIVYVISASSGDRLAQFVRKQSLAETSRIVMMFSFAPGDFPCVVRLPKPGDFESCKRSEILQKLKDHLRPIRILGEHFLIEHKKPRLARLAVAHRLDDAILGKIRFLTNVRVLEVFPRTLSGDPTRKFSLTPRIFEAEPLQQYLVEWIEPALRSFLQPADDAAIVTVQGPNSAPLQMLVKEIASAILESPPTIIAGNQLRASAQVENKKRIVVCADVVGSGRSLVDVSAALRATCPAAHVLYLTPFHLSESSNDAKTLVQNLTAPKATGQFKFATWFQLPIGPKPSKGVVDAMALLDRQFPPKNGGDHDVCSALRNVDVHTLTPLALLLPKGYEISAFDLTWAYVIHAAALQRAREHFDPKDNGLVLRSDEFEQVLLDPSVFERFSDPSIRAAILWHAKDTELDYSGDELASKQMATSIKRWAESDVASTRTVVAEFMFALISDHMRLSDDDLARVTDTLQVQAANLPAEVTKLLPVLIREDNSD